MTSGGNKSPNAANGLLVNISRLLLRSGSILDGSARAGERRALCGHRELEYLVAHRVEIAEHQGRRRGEAGDGSGIDEPGAAALHGRDALDARLVGVPAAHQVPVPGAGHRIAVLRVMHQEDFSSAQLQARVGAVVVEQSAARARQIVQRERVSHVVAVNDMHVYSRAQRGPQRVGADQVAAMDDGLRTFGCRVVYGALERVGAIVAVRDDADLHAADRLIAACIASRAVDLCPLRHTSSVFTRATACGNGWIRSSLSRRRARITERGTTATPEPAAAQAMMA